MDELKEMREENIRLRRIVKSIQGLVGKADVKTGILDATPYEDIGNLYAFHLPMLPKVRNLTSERKKHIRARWQKDLPSLNDWDLYFKDVSKSPFLTGKTQPTNGHRKFVADIDFLIRESTIVKMQEGKYHG